MIVNYTADGWEIITQRSHGLLASQLANQWKFDKIPERWMETLLAIAEHDDAEIELAGDDVLTEQGGPVNFAMKKFDLEHCKKMSAFAITKSRYIAVLTSLHMEFLHQKEEDNNPLAKDFLEEQRKLRSKWIQELHLNNDDVYKAYSLLEWCDAMSLLLCKQQVQPEHRAIEISEGPDGVKYQLFHIENNKLTLTPWPFKIASFKVYFELRKIKQLQFKSPDEFIDAFNKAEVSETVWELIETTVPVKGSKV